MLIPRVLLPIVTGALAVTVFTSTAMSLGAGMTEPMMVSVSNGSTSTTLLSTTRLQAGETVFVDNFSGKDYYAVVRSIAGSTVTLDQVVSVAGEATRSQ